MAGFGPIASPAPNVLYNPMAIDAAVMGAQRNRLMMEQAAEDRRFSRIDREREEVGRVAASLLSLPAEQRPQAYAAARADMQRAGIGLAAPEQYPGDTQVEQMARAAMPAAMQFQLAEKRRASEAMMGMLGGMMGGAELGGMPGGGGGPGFPVTAPASGPAAPPPVMPRNYAAGEEARAQVLDAPPAVHTANSASRTTVPELPGGYRANPGVGGAYQGVAPPTGTINPNVGGGGLTPMQRAAIAAAAMTNPGAAAGMIMQAQGQNAAASRAAADDARADTRFRVDMADRERTRQYQERGFQRQEALDRARLDREREEAERRARTEGVPSGYRRTDAGTLEPVPGGPADPSRRGPEQATEAERKAAGYLGRMQGAEQLLETMVREGYDPGNIRDRVAQTTPVAGNFISTERGQQYMNAAEEWARAKLRLESGAVIGQEEARAEARTYFPMPGDSPATIAQKARLRATAVEGVRAQAGRAVPTPQAAAPAGPDGGTPLVVPPPAQQPQRLRFNPATGRIE